MERNKVSRDADERTTLMELLRFYRATMLLKSDGLNHAQLNQTLPPSSLTIAGLIKHLAVVEDTWILERFLGRALPEPWLSAPWEQDEDWDFNSAVDDSPEYLRDLYEAACARTDAGIADIPLDTLASEPYYSGRPWTLRWVLLHLIEETARHAGHADLIRESIDGSVGV